MFGRNNTAESHTWIEARLSDYIDNQLAPAERTRLEQHIGECDRCRASLESMRWSIALLKQAPIPALHRSFTLAVPARRAQPSFAFGFARLATAMATLAFVAVIGVDLIMRLGTGASSTAMAPAAQKISEPTIAIALAPTTADQAPPTSAPKPGEASKAVGAPTTAASSAAALPPAPANVPPPAPTKAPESSAFRSEASPTRSAADTAKSLAATQTARQPALGSGIITATIVLPTTTVAPTQTATPVSPTATLAPTTIAQAQKESAPVSPPAPATTAEPILSPLRIIEIGLFFAMIFFGTLAVMMWRRR